MPCVIIAGGQFGDEGKGKVIAYLALHDKPKIVARAGVGPNAGHTVIWQGKKLGLRQVPCGLVYEGARLLIGPGVLVNPEVLLKEVEDTKIGDRIGVDRQCTVIEKQHIEQDRTSDHLKGTIGTTGTGCGPANVARVGRVARLAKDTPELQRFLADVPGEVNGAIKNGELVMPRSSGPVWQQPLRKKPVSGRVPHSARGPPSTLRGPRGVELSKGMRSGERAVKRPL